MKKRKVIFVFIFICCIISLLWGSKKINDYYSWADEKTTTFPPDRIQSNDTLRVIMIGDSWAAFHHNNDTILSTLLQNKLRKPISVISSGMVGAKTKTIYELMFDTISSCGTQKLLKQHPDYCIISTGINDAIAKLGVQNYCFHYDLIINNLLSLGITPIVIDMPDVDYKAVYQKESIIANIRHKISSWITNSPMWTFDNYRKALYANISKEGLKYHIIYVPSTEWNPKGYEDPRIIYLEDHIHLNQKGYYLLDSCLASYIQHDYMLIHDSQ